MTTVDKLPAVARRISESNTRYHFGAFPFNEKLHIFGAETKVNKSTPMIFEVTWNDEPSRRNRSKLQWRVGVFLVESLALNTDIVDWLQRTVVKINRPLLHPITVRQLRAHSKYEPSLPQLLSVKSTGIPFPLEIQHPFAGPPRNGSSKYCEQPTDCTYPISERPPVNHFLPPDANPVLNSTTSPSCMT